MIIGKTKPRFLSAEQKAQVIAQSLGVQDDEFRLLIKLKPTLVNNLLQIGHLTQQTYKTIQHIRDTNV